MGSTSFWGFFYPNLLLIFSEPVIFRNLCRIILDFLWVFCILFLFFGTLFWVSIKMMDAGYSREGSDSRW